MMGFIAVEGGCVFLFQDLVKARSLRFVERGQRI